MDCPQMKRRSYAELCDGLIKKHGLVRHPMSGSMELTARCNMNCGHCYINLPADSSTALSRELETKEIFCILDQLTQAGCLWLLLTGGEPLLRPDFLQIYDYVKRLGLLPTVFTNGTLLTRRIADHMAEFPPHAVEISLYGRTQETYEKVTRTRGSYESCLRAINLIMERRLPLRIKTTVSLLNQHELPDIRKYVEDLGVEFRFDAVLNGRIDRRSAPVSYRLSPEAVVALDLADLKRSEEWRSIPSAALRPASDPSFLYQCSAAQSSFHIDSYGMISPCLTLRQPGFDLRQVSFTEAWEALGRIRTEKRIKPSPCVTCGFSLLCGNCPGNSIAETGDPEGITEYLCRIGRLRGAAFGLGSEREDIDGQ